MNSYTQLDLINFLKPDPNPLLYSLEILFYNFTTGWISAKIITNSQKRMKFYYLLLENF